MSNSEYKVEVRKLLGLDLLRESISFILDLESTMTLEKIYRTQHSPCRTQLFIVKMVIPNEVSVHLVRHSAVGQFHYVSSNRPDWQGHSAREHAEIGRDTLVRHVMILNAKHLMDMAGERLCTKALATTRKVFSMITEEMSKIDKDLANRMKPKCYRQGGVCYEDDPCGVHMNMLREIVEQVPEAIYRDWRNDFIVRNYKG